MSLGVQDESWRACVLTGPAEAQKETASCSPGGISVLLQEAVRGDKGEAGGLDVRRWKYRALGGP